MSKKSFIVFIAITLCCVGVSRAQIVALKTDVLGWATASFSVFRTTRGHSTTRT